VRGKRFLIYVMLATCIASLTKTNDNVFVTNLPLGRTGAHLGCYLKAKAAAAYLGAPFILTLFPYSAEFSLHNSDPQRSKFAAFAGKKVTVKTTKQLEKIKCDISKNHIKQPTLYVIHGCLRINIREFLSDEEIKTLLSPLKKIDGPTPPPGYTSVAVHVRTGGGFDSELSIATQPEHFTGIHYYATQMQHLADKYPDTKFWFFIFTDDQHPAKLVSALSKLVNAPNISMEYRRKNRHNINIVEDIILMSRCRYLIKPKSSYSGMAAIIGKHEEVLDLKSGAYTNNPWRPGK